MNEEKKNIKKSKGFVEASTLFRVGQGGGWYYDYGDSWRPPIFKKFKYFVLTDDNDLGFRLVLQKKRKK